MKKILKSLIFPAISILIIAMIYAGLTIENLNNKALAAKKQNQDLSLKQSNLEKQLDEIQASIIQITSDNNDLRKNLAETQKQILALQNRKVRENSVSVAEPVVITKVVTQTLTQEIERNEATVIIENVGSYKINLQNGDNAFTVLERASAENGFALTYDTYPFGVFITGIGGITPTGNQYWAFYYNGAYSNVGASSQPVQKGDSIVWRLATF